jgi:hypothetical protein
MAIDFGWQCPNCQTYHDPPPCDHVPFTSSHFPGGLAGFVTHGDAISHFETLQQTCRLDKGTKAGTAKQFKNLGARWREYRPSKGLWALSCAGCVAATVTIGFFWVGWVTSETATAMSAEAALRAKAQLVAAYCVSRFDAGPDASIKLAVLKSIDGPHRSDFIGKGGWTKMPGVAQDVKGAADLCAQKLIRASTAQAKPSPISG